VPGGIENATHKTLERKPGHGAHKYPALPPDVLWVAFSIPPGSLSVVKYPVYHFSRYVSRKTNMKNIILVFLVKCNEYYLIPYTLNNITRMGLRFGRK
jgi:hypothetical protein